jgi:uncharacterized protein (DUF433 family)
MSADERLTRISVDPEVCGGRPCIRGHRITVAMILGLLADGISVASVLTEYPQIEEVDVRACLAFGAVIASGGYDELACALPGPGPATQVRQALEGLEELWQRMPEISNADIESALKTSREELESRTDPDAAT